ncbi:tyrosine-type recombinase/integrase [Streptomyces sp. NPDC048507]|uniref:tyrosine-type recombinase/integrase n=1 Tax=Streptomyces sp. NPDC048507 TaxID=3365560 RepID=UPI003717FA4F
MAKRRLFGSIKQLKSGRFHVRYPHPVTGVSLNGPTTFETEREADEYLARVRSRIADGIWVDPILAGVTLDSFAATDYFPVITVSDRTLERYRDDYTKWVSPPYPESRSAVHLGAMRLSAVNVVAVDNWYAAAKVATRKSAIDYYTRTGRTAPSDAGATQLAGAYRVLRQIMNQAVRQKRIFTSPCTISNAGTVKDKGRSPATPAEVAKASLAMPPRYRLSPLAAAWSAFRPEELFAVPRHGWDREQCAFRVVQVLEELRGQPVRIKPLAKNDASLRTVHMPRWFGELMEEHLAEFVPEDPMAIIFATSNDVPPSRSYRSAMWSKARRTIGRTDLRFYDLRHTGAKFSAETGASIRQIMHRMGHKTTRAALIYQSHSSQEDRDVAGRMESQRPGTVIDLTARRAVWLSPSCPISPRGLS